MSYLRIAAQLMKDREWFLARTILENYDDKQNLSLSYWLSLLYRYLDDYESEKALLDNSQQTSSYFEERKRWHQLDWFDKLVPREPLHMPRNPDTMPSQEILEQFCIVTAGGSDQPYYNLLIELLESIKASPVYKHVPIGILDTGLTDEHKHYLYSGSR